ncbi:MAG: hypothetical protein EBX99_02915 [Acidimicrobiia bacterium]|nr:hypothetical protein [Acidimicrobiia bacterium]
MKINRNNKYITAGLAAIAVAGLALGASGCFGGTNFDGANEPVGTEESTDVSIENDSAQRVADTNSGISAPDDHVTTADVATADVTTADVTTADVTTADDASDDASDGSSITAESTHDDAASSDAGEPVFDTPATDTPATDTSDESETVTDPSIEAPADDSAPEISTGSGSHPFGDVTAMPGATVEEVYFVGTNGDADAIIFAKESGFGGNDIVSVKLVYYVAGVKTSSVASLGINASSTRSLWNAEHLNLTEGMSVSVRLTDERGRTTYHDVVVTFSTMG